MCAVTAVKCDNALFRVTEEVVISTDAEKECDGCLIIIFLISCFTIDNFNCYIFVFGITNLMILC